jgi:hypothetical protein
VFIDGFGLYRNSYRSLVGVYAIPAGLDGDDVIDQLMSSPSP